jgi:hypothetical protein
MDSPEVTGGQLVLFMLIGLVAIVVYPFAKAFLMYIAIRMLKFQNLSYWKALFCVLIGIGTMMAVQMILVGLALQPGQELDPDAIAGANLIAMLLSLILTPVAEAISLLLFFKESPGKTIGAIALTYLFAIALAIVLFLLFLALMFLVGLATS